MRTTAGTGVHEHVRTTTFPRHIQAAPTARQFVRQAAAGHPAADDPVLLAAQLIPNSMVHAVNATTVTITLAAIQAFSRVDAPDDGPLRIPHMHPTDPESDDDARV